MTLTEVFFTAAALSTDAFAVAICTGIMTGKFKLQNALIIGFYFGLFQAGMPLIGYLLTSFFSGEAIAAYGSLIAFALLSFLGGKMVYGSIKNKDCGSSCPVSIKAKHILPFAIATSIDALAAGISFAFLQVNIIIAVLLIGILTFIMSASGVKLGNIFGEKLKSKAELIGGGVLILIGLNILQKHLQLF